MARESQDKQKMETNLLLAINLDDDWSERFWALIGFHNHSAVNFTNILQAAFAPIFLRQKSTNLSRNYKKNCS